LGFWAGRDLVLGASLCIFSLFGDDLGSDFLCPVDFINTYLIIGMISELIFRQINSYKVIQLEELPWLLWPFSFILPLILGVERENMRPTTSSNKVG